MFAAAGHSSTVHPSIGDGGWWCDVWRTPAAWDGWRGGSGAGPAASHQHEDQTVRALPISHRLFFSPELLERSSVCGASGGKSTIWVSHALHQRGLGTPGEALEAAGSGTGLGASGARKSFPTALHSQRLSLTLIRLSLSLSLRCEHFARGGCQYGERCHFAHGDAELRA